MRLGGGGDDHGVGRGEQRVPVEHRASSSSLATACGAGGVAVVDAGEDGARRGGDLQRVVAAEMAGAGEADAKRCSRHFRFGEVAAALVRSATRSPARLPQGERGRQRRPAGVKFDICRGALPRPAETASGAAPDDAVFLPPQDRADPRHLRPRRAARAAQPDAGAGAVGAVAHDPARARPEGRQLPADGGGHAGGDQGAAGQPGRLGAAEPAPGGGAAVHRHAAAAPEPAAGASCRIRRRRTRRWMRCASWRWLRPTG